MTRTLAWKELREHQGIWIAMVCMTIGLGLGLSKLVSLNDAHLALPVAAFTILGMAATYGIVCGSMMFAGEHEGGTLVFLDIFLGRRGLLWTGKFAFGIVLVLTQAICVAALLALLDQQAPRWSVALIGLSAENAHPGAVLDGTYVWYLILPVVTLEAFAWGLLGSTLTRRVLGSAAIAAVGFTPVWLLALTAPGPVFFPFRIMLAVGLLVISLSTFLNQSREAALGPPAPAEPDRPLDPKDQFFAAWDHFERKEDHVEAQRGGDAPVSVPMQAVLSEAVDPVEDGRVAVVSRAFEAELEPAQSPREVLWWLTTQQARPMVWSLAVASLFVGLILIQANIQALWPLATLLLGVVCGTAAFAPEQRDLSYQFLAAQHFPLKRIWQFKIGFWLTIAVTVAATMFLGTIASLVLLLVRPGPIPGARFNLFGTFVEQLGLPLFLGVWLAYGFCVGQVFVWLCRKTILALLISFMVSAAAISLWLPSLLCGGMSGWQVWVPPLTLLVATSFLMRAWAGGRIWERTPIVALGGFGAGIGVWAAINFGYRAWEVPNVDVPLDTAAYRSALPTNKDNLAAKAIQKAIGHFEEAEGQRNKLAEVERHRLEVAWLSALAEAARLPVGMLEPPHADGHMPLLKHLATCRKMAIDLLIRSRTADRSLAFDYLTQILALSRNLRNKAMLESYLAGIDLDKEALDGLDHWLERGKPDAKLLRHVLDELNHHAEETPPPLDCLQTECFRSSGMLSNPYAWTFAARGGPGKIPEPWVAGSIVLSMETPWEQERAARLWQLVWAGLFRGVQTPHWELPSAAAEPPTHKSATLNILRGWLPATQGADVTHAQMVRLLDASWLADERLFCSAALLREKSTRARWHVDAMRLTTALALYRLEQEQTPKELQQLVSKYLPTGLPLDPYSGQSFRYRLEAGDRPAVIWSTGPDKIDHGGFRHGGALADRDAQWRNGTFDLITSVPLWR